MSSKRKLQMYKMNKATSMGNQYKQKEKKHEVQIANFICIPQISTRDDTQEKYSIQNYSI